MARAYKLLTGSTLQPLATTGTIVYAYSGHDYGLARDDTRATGIEHVSVTLEINGGPPSFTIPQAALKPTEHPVPFIDDEHLRAYCQPGKGALTCKYLAMSSGGWDCLKHSTLQCIIDQRTNMNAKGDNCDGRRGR